MWAPMFDVLHMTPRCVALRGLLKTISPVERPGSVNFRTNQGGIFILLITEHLGQERTDTGLFQFEKKFDNLLP